MFALPLSSLWCMKNANPWPQAVTLRAAAEVLERADREATEDPAAAVPVAIEAVRATRAVGIVCLESRALRFWALPWPCPGAGDSPRRPSTRPRPPAARAACPL